MGFRRPNEAAPPGVEDRQLVRKRRPRSNRCLISRTFRPTCRQSPLVVVAALHPRARALAPAPARRPLLVRPAVVVRLRVAPLARVLAAALRQLLVPLAPEQAAVAGLAAAAAAAGDWR